MENLWKIIRKISLFQRHCLPLPSKIIFFHNFFFLKFSCFCTFSFFFFCSFLKKSSKRLKFSPFQRTRRDKQLLHEQFLKYFKMLSAITDYCLKSCFQWKARATPFGLQRRVSCPALTPLIITYIKFYRWYVWIRRSVGWSVGRLVGRSHFTFFFYFISLSHFKSF